MAFLIRRNIPRAYAGWFDNFDRPNENPVKQPWGANGGFATANVQLKDGALEMDQGYVAPLGAVSYEFQPFTEVWGCEFDIWMPAGGLAAQSFLILIGGSWAKREGSFINSAAIRFFYRSVGQTNPVGIYEFNDVVSTNATLQEQVLAGGSNWWNVPHNIRLWVDGKTVRMWIDGVLTLGSTFRGVYGPGPGKRAVNFNNQLFVNNRITNYKLYDRPKSDLFNGWSSVLWEDDFNRVNNPSIGNGWVKLGRTGTVIQTNSLAYTSGSDNPSWVNQDGFPMPTGDCRIETTLGGSRAPQNAETYMRYQRINARINSSRTNFLSLWFSREKMAIVRGVKQMNDQAYPGTSGWQLIDDQTNVDNLKSGDKVAFCVRGDDAWAEVNGKIVMAVSVAGLTNPAVDRGWGLGLDRANFGTSGSFDDVTYQSSLV